MREISVCYFPSVHRTHLQPAEVAGGFRLEAFKLLRAREPQPLQLVQRLPRGAGETGTVSPLRTASMFWGTTSFEVVEPCHGWSCTV